MKQNGQSGKFTRTYIQCRVASILPADQGFIVGGTGYTAYKGMSQSQCSNCPCHQEDDEIDAESPPQLKADVVIFDESSQLTLPLAIAGMHVGQRYVLLGDHRQLGPIINGQHPNLRVTASVFDTLVKRSPGTMLNITYRMNDAILQFPNQRFYDNKLKSHEDVRHRHINFKNDPVSHFDILDPEFPSTFVDIKYEGDKAPNHLEAVLVAELVEEACKCGLTSRQISIISPYRPQVVAIRDAVKARGLDPQLLFIDTVHRMQGQERELVIFSMGVGSQAFATKNAQFLFDPKLINTAITRAKYKRIIVANPNILEASSVEYSEWIGLFNAFHDSCHIVSR